MKTEEKIQKITAMLYACGITLRDCKDELRFAPPELSKAIGSLREAEPMGFLEPNLMKYSCPRIEALLDEIIQITTEDQKAK